MAGAVAHPALYLPADHATPMFRCRLPLAACLKLLHGMPKAMALLRTRESRVAMITSACGSSKAPAVARWIASRVRIGSIGKRRPAWARIASVTLTMKQRRVNLCSVSGACRSCGAVMRRERRARSTARFASVMVRAEVTRCPFARIDTRAWASFSSTAATNALVSM